MSAPAVADFAALEAALDEKRAAVEAALPGLLRRGSPEVDAAVEYSLLAPAKRVRPVLTLMVAELFRVDARLVLPAACAVEMAHTASLILDDLPAMDDALLRRGRETCHRVHGQANAILAAFALLNRGFELLAEGWTGGPDAALRGALARELAGAVGTEGMIAGQARDLSATDRGLSPAGSPVGGLSPAGSPVGGIDFATLEFIHSRKTGALFVASAAIGALAAAASATETAAVKAYAKNLGLAFQIVDDLIDAGGRAAEAGKDVQQDLKKTTFVSFSGREGAAQLARELAQASQEALRPFGERARALRALALYVVTRRR
jgi:geranylgeranyl pyrophosphate synthase